MPTMVTAPEARYAEHAENSDHDMLSKAQHGLSESTLPCSGLVLLRQLLQCFMLRRTKAALLRRNALQLPPLTEAVV